MTDGTNNGIDGYSQTRVGDHTILTPKDKKASVYQKVTPREQYAVARDVANRAINEINAIRGDRPSSFTGGINDANIAARMQAAETYGDTLPSRQTEASPISAPKMGPGSAVGVIGSLFGGLRAGRPSPPRNLIDADRVSDTAPQISEIRGDWGYGPSIRYPEPTATPVVIDDPGGTDPGGTDPGGTDPGGTDPGGTEEVVVNEKPWYKERKGAAGQYNQTLEKQGWAGTHWTGPKDDDDIYGTGSFARTNWLTDQFTAAAGDDNVLSYDEYVKGVTTRPDDNAYQPYTISNALSNYWATSGATIDPKALDNNDLILQDDKLLQKLYQEDTGPNLAYKDYVNFDSWQPDGDTDGWNYFRWSRK